MNILAYVPTNLLLQDNKNEYYYDSSIIYCDYAAEWELKLQILLSVTAIVLIIMSIMFYYEKKNGEI